MVSPTAAPAFFLAATEDFTDAGIYHGNLDFESNSDDLIDSAQLLPHPALPASPSLSPSRQDAAQTAIPISIALTEFHFLLLYRDRVLGISNLNEQLAYEELLPLVSTNLNAAFLADVQPSAVSVGELALGAYQRQEFQDVAYYEPFYLKEVYTTTPRSA